MSEHSSARGLGGGVLAATGLATGSWWLVGLAAVLVVAGAAAIRLTRRHASFGPAGEGADAE